MSLTKSEFENEHVSLLREKHQETVNNIKELQEIEKYMFQNLQQLSGEGSNNTQQQIIDKINELSNMRIGLFNELKNDYSGSQGELDSSRRQLADQVTMVGVMEDELTRLKRNIKTLENEKNNKIRMVEVGNYESDRYLSHISIMRIIAYSSIIILITSVLLQNGLISSGISTIIILGTVLITMIMLLYKVYDMYSRNSFDYNKYDFTYDPSQYKKGYESVIEHDKKFFNKLGGEFRSGFNEAKENIEKTMSGLTIKAETAASGIASGVKSTLSNADESDKDKSKNSKVEDTLSKGTENFALYY